MLEFKSVRKRFEKNEVLKELTFRLDAGEILGLLAPNGGGKTTAMRIAMGLIPFDDGAVTVFDKPVKPGAVRGVGYMPEERGLYPNERVEDQLRYFARLSKMSPTAIDRRMVELLDELNVLRYKNKKVKELSLGNKQRVQIAAALIGKPQLLILDEPFSGLDPIAVQFFSNLLRKYASQDAGILFSSHQLDVVEQVATRIGIMKEGQLAFDGGLEELKKNNRKSIAILRFQRDEASAKREISFENCPNVISSTVSAGKAELEFSVERISVEEIALSGLRAEEIVEVSYKRNTFSEALSELYTEEEQTESVKNEVR